MRNVSDKICTKNQNAHIMLIIFRKSCRLLNRVKQSCYRPGVAQRIPGS